MNKLFVNDEILYKSNTFLAIHNLKHLKRLLVSH